MTKPDKRDEAYARLKKTASKEKGAPRKPSSAKPPTPSTVANAKAAGVPLVRGVPVPQSTDYQVRKPPSAEDLKVISNVDQKSVPALLDTATYVPLEFAQMNYVPQTADTKECAVFVNKHRNTCIRTMIGRRKVTYIPLDASGIMVRHIGVDIFNAEWRLTLPDYDPAHTAYLYLQSYQAKHHISKEARTLLEEIIKQGAKFKSKENTMTTTKAATPKKPGDYDAKTAAATYDAAVKPPATKPKPPAKVAKPTNGGGGSTSKGVKTASTHSSKATKASKKAAPAPKSKAKAPAAAKRTTYAGKKISKPASHKEALAAVRDGTFRKALMKHISRFTTVDSAVGSSFDYNKEERVVASIDIKVAVDLGIIKIS